jgi:hypothetical protein
MSDSSISIVCKISTYPNNREKAQEILAWLVSKDIVEPYPSDCTLGSENGYAISGGASAVVDEPEYLRFGPGMINGLEVVADRQVFHTGQNGLDELICPVCNKDISKENWDFDPWCRGETDDLTCPSCGKASEIHNYTFKPEWGFSNLGFEFWGCPPFTTEFIEEFKGLLNCDVNIVFSHI